MLVLTDVSKSTSSSFAFIGCVGLCDLTSFLNVSLPWRHGGLMWIARCIFDQVWSLPSCYFLRQETLFLINYN